MVKRRPEVFSTTNLSQTKSASILEQKIENMTSGTGCARNFSYIGNVS